MTTMYTSDHEWINIEDHEAAVVGITHHAQDALGDVVFVELPEVGRTYTKGEVAGVVESVKALPTCSCRSKAKSSKSTKPCAPTRRSRTPTPGQRLVLQGAHHAHGAVRRTDGPAGVRRAAEDAVRP